MKLLVFLMLPLWLAAIFLLFWAVIAWCYGSGATGARLGNCCHFGGGNHDQRRHPDLAWRRNRDRDLRRHRVLTRRLREQRSPAADTNLPCIARVPGMSEEYNELDVFLRVRGAGGT